MSFPVEIAGAISSIATGSLTLLTSVVTSYWPYLIGLGVLMGLGYRFRRIFGLVR